MEADALADCQNPMGRSFCYFLVGLRGQPFVVDGAGQGASPVQ
ncbi:MULTISPECIES: hypothetical protein [unclassified Streptomyces]